MCIYIYIYVYIVRVQCTTARSACRVVRLRFRETENIHLCIYHTHIRMHSRVAACCSVLQYVCCSVLQYVCRRGD